jgi:hypothetical protein
MAAAGAALFAGTTPAPSGATIAEDVAWLTASYAFLGLLGCAVSTTIGSQSISIGVLLGWHIAASNLLLQATALGKLRWAVPLGALDRLQPASHPFLTGMPVAAAIGCLVGWILLSGAAGAARTATMDV